MLIESFSAGWAMDDQYYSSSIDRASHVPESQAALTLAQQAQQAAFDATHIDRVEISDPARPSQDNPDAVTKPQ
jgi:hypothetical protein